MLLLSSKLECILRSKYYRMNTKTAFPKQKLKTKLYFKIRYKNSKLSLHFHNYFSYIGIY